VQNNGRRKLMPGAFDELLEKDRLRGFRSVRLAKDRLLERIRKNRDDHRAIFEEALDGWKSQVAKDLEEAAEAAKVGKAFKVHFGLVKPEDHTDDYDSVIALLEMSEDDEFELTWHEFQNYVMDKWDWQATFLTNSSSYGSMRAYDKGEELNMRLTE